MKTNQLHTRDLSIGYRHGRRAPDVVATGLNVGLLQGELVCLLGPNGAGKSTLMRTLAGMQPALEGKVLVGDQALSELTPEARARHISVVLTDRVDVGHLAVEDLVGLGRYPHTGWLGRLTSHDLEVVRWAMQVTDTVDLAQRHVGELSDGERQKAMIARALAQEAEVMFLDEPTAFLDLPRRVEIMHLLRRLSRETHRAILVSTHDLDLALRCAHRIWLMKPGAGLRIGVPEALVLNGALAETFARGNIAFDPHEGAFRGPQGGGKGIVLRGDGLALTWTARALEREGFAVNRNLNGAGIAIDARGDGSEASWVLSWNGREAPHACLESLLDAVKAIAAG